MLLSLPNYRDRYTLKHHLNDKAVDLWLCHSKSVQGSSNTFSARISARSHTARQFHWWTISPSLGEIRRLLLIVPSVESDRSPFEYTGLSILKNIFTSSAGIHIVCIIIQSLLFRKIFLTCRCLNQLPLFLLFAAAIISNNLHDGIAPNYSLFVSPIADPFSLFHHWFLYTPVFQ